MRSTGLSLRAAGETDERDVREGLLATPSLASRPGRRTVIADKAYGRDFKAPLDHVRIDLLRPARTGEKSQATARFFRPLRQVAALGGGAGFQRDSVMAADCSANQVCASPFVSKVIGARCSWPSGPV